MQKTQSTIALSPSNIMELSAVIKSAAQEALQYDSELKFELAIPKYVEAIENLQLLLKSIFLNISFYR